MTTIENLTAETFDAEVLGSTDPVLVDFWADWCRPCHAMTPVLTELAERAPHALRVVKVDIDAHPDLAATYQVQSIPNMVLFTDGQPRGRIVGAMPAAQLDAQLEHLFHGTDTDH